LLPPPGAATGKKAPLLIQEGPERERRGWLPVRRFAFGVVTGTPCLPQLDNPRPPSVKPHGPEEGRSLVVVILSEVNPLLVIHDNVVDACGALADLGIA